MFGLITEILTLMYLIKKCKFFEQQILWRVVEVSTGLGEQMYGKYIEVNTLFEQSIV